MVENVNLSLPGAHIPDIKRANSVLQELFRTVLYHLPFKLIPRSMIKFPALGVIRHGNYFLALTGISKHYSPQNIVSGRQNDFRKELVHSYCDYVEANTTHLIKNKNLPQTLDCIYLRANNTLQGGYQIIDLATGHIISQQSVIPCVMTMMVTHQVELLVTQKGYKTLKFFDPKKSKLMLSNADLLE